MFQNISTKDFLLFPSPSKLKALGSHCVDDIVSYVEVSLVSRHIPTLIVSYVGVSLEPLP